MTKKQRAKCKKLIKELRSGKYEQTCGTLCWYKEESKLFCYCVQGVAYKLIGYDEISKYSLGKNGINAVPVMSSLSKKHAAAIELTDAYGLSTDEWRQLLNLNDFGKIPFLLLSNKIEEMVNGK